MIKEKPLKSSESQIDSFMSSVVWKDMITMLEERIEYLTDMLVSTDSSDMNTIIELKGEIKAMKQYRNLPQMMKKCVVVEINNQQIDESHEPTNID